MTDSISEDAAEKTAVILRLLQGLPIYESIAVLETVKFALQMAAWEKTGGITMTVHNATSTE